MVPVEVTVKGSQRLLQGYFKVTTRATMRITIKVTLGCL